MKIEKVYEFYENAIGAFQCPLCHSQLEMQHPASMVCCEGHCFDLSKVGYINLLPRQKPTMYTKELFESRRRVFEAGYYFPLLEQMQNLIEELFQERGNLRVLDAGCGEGFYSGSLKEYFPGAMFYGFDNLKEAVQMAAKKYKDVHWFVGDLTNIPLKDGSMDLILDVFTPANYGEFSRVLKDDGNLVKVVPGPHYLEELRASIDKGNYSNDQVVHLFSGNMVLKKKVDFSYKKEVSREILEAFLRMTPMMFGMQDANIDIGQLEELTFDFTILVGKK